MGFHSLSIGNAAYPNAYYRRETVIAQIALGVAFGVFVACLVIMIIGRY